jgi:peptidoglycan hydrolase-like protein with peptidoglycan-binding domain
MTNTMHPEKDWSGHRFAVPTPVPLTRAWRVKFDLRRPVKVDATYALVNTVLGEDSIAASGCTPGLPVYAGYYNGTFANLNSFRATFPAAVILSITPNGEKGARCIDCEPGDATVAEAADFVAANLPVAGAGGRNDGGKPMVYCSAGDAQAVINAISAKGISRGQWDLWSAHWIGQHICSPSSCGYPQADATQYNDGITADYDEFYSYCFGVPVSPWPLQEGDTGALVSTLQSNVNKWITALAGAFGATVMLTVDGDFGPLTKTAVAVAQQFFGERGVAAGVCDQALYNELAAAPVSPWPLKSGDTGELVALLQADLNKWKFGNLAVDGNFGPLTAAAVHPAQGYFKNGSPAGECDQALFADLAGSPPPPPPPPFTYRPVQNLTLLGAGPDSVKFEFTAGAQDHAGLAKFQVAICKGDKLGAVIAKYPRYIDFVATGKYEQQFGGVEPSTGYVLAVRGMAQDGSHASAWAMIHFETAA